MKKKLKKSEFIKFFLKTMKRKQKKEKQLEKKKI